MADPFAKEQIGAVEPPPPPAPKTRTSRFVAHGIPPDIEAAKTRLIANKAKRMKKRKTAKHLGTSLPAGYVDAFDSLCERYDASKAQVMKRILEDGFRAYCDDEELEIAGIPRKKPANPFEVIREPEEHPRYEHWVPPQSNGEAHYEPEAGAQPKPPPGTILFTGEPPPDNAEAYT